MSHILVVDDDRVSRLLMVKILQAKDISCLVAESAEEALDIIKSHKVSILLTDLRMAGMDGIELYRRISGERPALRGILCSAYLDYDVITDVMELGFDDCLIKPIKKEMLLESVARSLRTQAHWRSRIAELRQLSMNAGGKLDGGDADG